MENKNETRVIAGVVRFSYLHVWEPYAMEGGGGKEKYSVCLLIPKSDKKLIAQINKGIEAAKEVGKVKKWDGKIPAKLKLPLRDGDEDNDRNDESKYGHFYINANADASTPPEIVEKNNGKLVPISDRNEFYSGCYGYASISFYPYNNNGNRGIACGLNNLMKTKDGEPLGGIREKAETEFAEIDVDDEENLI